MGKDDPKLYLKIVEDEPVILLLYVDDLFLTGNEKQIMESKKKLAEEFGMKDLGLMHYCWKYGKVQKESFSTRESMW